MGGTNVFAVGLLGSLAGTVLCAVLLVALVRKRPRTPAEWLLGAVLACAAVWHTAHAVQGLVDAAGQGMPDSSVGPLRWIVAVAGAALLLHLSILWAFGESARTVRIGLSVYPVAAAAAWFTGSAAPYGPRLFGGALLGAAAFLMMAGQSRTSPPVRACLAWSAGSLMVWALCLFSTANRAALVLASVLPLVCLAWFIYRFNVFDLLISRRTSFVFTLSVVSALYLVVVRFLAAMLESGFGTFGVIVETVLILGAVVTWLPIYQLITRFFSRQSRIHVEFTRRVIEEAAGILDLQQRAQFLISQVSRTFAFPRAALVLGGDPPQLVHHGGQAPAWTPEESKALCAAVERLGRSTIRVSGRLQARDIARPLAAAHYNYAFPLYCQDRLTGLMLLDTSPRTFLDDAETTILGLSSQISLSLESCRLNESKLRLEKELLEQTQMATLGAFAATVAHEVKNPLSSIKTLTQLLREDPDVLSRYSRELDFIVGETNRLNSSVQQLLTFARPLPETREEVGLTELLMNSAAFVSLDGANPGVTIERRIQPELKLPSSDAKSIQQVVLNLLLNAVQASPPGGKVTLDAAREPSGVISFSITDEGPGIAADLREKVFEPFYTTKPQGTGLGLAIVRKNIQHLHAQLVLESPLPGNGAAGGTRIRVRFPNAPGATG